MGQDWEATGWALLDGPCWTCWGERLERGLRNLCKWGVGAERFQVGGARELRGQVWAGG